MIFIEILMRQCHLAGVVNADEFNKNKYGIRFEYNKVNYFSELKKMEILTERMNLVSTISGVKENFIPSDWIYREVLMLNDQEVAEIKEMLAKEALTMAGSSDGGSDDSGETGDTGDTAAAGDFYDTSAFDGGGEEDSTEAPESEPDDAPATNISSLIKSITSLSDVDDEEKTNFISSLIQVNGKSSSSSKKNIAVFLNKNFSKIKDDDMKTIASLIGGNSK
jgi:hypothetical protein